MSKILAHFYKNSDTEKASLSDLLLLFCHSDLDLPQIVEVTTVRGFLSILPKLLLCIYTHVCV